MKNYQSSFKYGDSGILAILSIFTVLYLFLFVRVLSRIGDEGIIVYGAQLVAQGALPYRDFFEGLGPASFYWLGLYFWLFGIKFAVARALLLITGTMTTLLIYWLTRRLFKGPFDYLPALFYMFISIPLWPGSSHHWDSNLFALLAVASFILWQDKVRSRYLIMAGLIAGFTSCFMLQKGFLLFLAFVILIIRKRMPACEDKRAAIVDLGIVTSAYVGIAIVVAALFYTAGGLHELIYATLLFPLSNYHNINAVPYGYGLWELIWPIYANGLTALFPSIPSHVFGIFIILPLLIVLTLPMFFMLFAARVYIDSTNRYTLSNSGMIICSITGIALWISEMQRMDFMHLVYGSPLLIIVTFALFRICCEKKKIIYTSGIALVYSSLILFALFNLSRAASAGTEYATRRGIIYSYATDQALKYLVEEVQPKSHVFVYPYYPMYYFLSDQINPSRYSILLYQYNTEAQFNETVDALEKYKVKHVLWDTYISGRNIKTWFPQYEHPAEEKLILEKYLLNHYVELDIRNGFRIMKRKNDDELEGG